MDTNAHTGPLIATHTAGEETARTRLSDYLPGIFASLQSRKSVKNALKKGLLRFNGRNASSGD